MNKKKLENLYLFHYFVLFVLLYLLIFLKLGSFHMRWWDESMFAVNTYEMMENGNFFSLSYNGKPDLFNTKPPLTTWLQIFFVKLFGYNELSLRLPSALAACLSTILLFKFTVKYFGYIMAWLSSLILMTSIGFIGFHTARTGDSDSLLTLFLLLANFSFIGYILGKNKHRAILSFFLWITLAFSTKLYAALLFIPGYLFILIYFKRLKNFMFNWSFFLGLLILLFSAFGLIYLREIQTPGYLNEILFKDAGRLFKTVVHSEPFFYYLDNLFNEHFSYWIIPFIMGSILVFYSSKKIHYNILLTTLGLILSYLLIITLSVTKLKWYDMPIFPYLSLISAIAIHHFVKQLIDSNQKAGLAKKYFLITAISFYPFLIMFSKSQGNTISYGDRVNEANELYLFEAIKNNENLDHLKIYFYGWNGGLLFYKYKLQEKGQSINIYTNTKDFQIGDKVLVSNDSLKIVLEQTFGLEKLKDYHTSELYLIKGRK